MERKHNETLVPNAKALRKNMTKEERRLWYEYLRSCPARFSRQKILGRYIVDFYCAELKLVLELDGSQHYEEAGRRQDEQRTAYLNGYDIQVIRIPNNEVMRNFSGVCDYIESLIGALRYKKSQT